MNMDSPSFLADGLAVVASRVSARRPTYLSLLRQRNVSQRKATRVRVSLRCAKGNLRCSQQAGSVQTRLSPQTCNLLYPPVTALLGTRTREGEGTSPRFASVLGGGGKRSCVTVAAAAAAAATAIERATPPTINIFHLSGSLSLSWRWCKAPAAAPVSLAPQFPCRRAEERSDRRMKQAACLSAASLQIARLSRAPQVARSVAQGHAYQGRLSFGYFSLAKQRKAARPPGRDPACHVNKVLTDRTQNA
jgi:hypothetical protein